MHDIITSLLLGIIEGVTEFLPVSSTAHLRLAEQYLFHISLEDPFWKMYSIVIQLGAVLCLPTYFHREIVRLLGSFRRRLQGQSSAVAFGDLSQTSLDDPRPVSGRPSIISHPLSLVMIAFVCTAGPAYLLTHTIAKNLESLTVIGGALLIGGAVMWAVDVLCTKPSVTRIDDVTLVQAIWVGLIQVFSAVFPGTSRSMSTIAAGQTSGMSRATALEFSFFLSMPTMAAATLFDLLKTLHPGKQAGEVAPLHMTGGNWIVLIVGFVVSYIVALGVVVWFMGWVRKHGLMPFAIYRILLGLAVLISVRMHTGV